MSEPRELFDKADALLGRYRGEAKPGLEPDYPVLTEVVEPLQGSGPPPAEAEAAFPREPAAPLRAQLTEGQLDAIEAQVVGQLQAWLPELVDAVFREAYAAQIEERLRRALHELAEQARADVERQLRERLSKALHRSIESLRERGETD
jgi:hypothetical protein